MSLLSVVIPAYNEGAMIHKTAEVVSSLLSENNIEYEIIFVNNSDPIPITGRLTAQFGSNYNRYF